MMHRFRASYGPAEIVATKLNVIRHEILENKLTESEILNLLQTPDYRDLGLHGIHIEIEKIGNELIWFSPNEKYNIGLDTDGCILWMHNGTRSNSF